MVSKVVEQFWENYLATLPDEHPHREAEYTAWGFGDHAELMNELAQLVLEGKKTATASAIWEYERDGEPLPQVGDLSVILSGDEQPLCIIETTELRTLPFNEVDAQFAYDEGEDDRTLESWRRGHQNFFERTFKDTELEFSETMPILCERFKVIYQPDGA